MALLNRWSDTEKTAYLVISLRGPAANALTNLPTEQCGSYEVLTTALDTHALDTHALDTGCGSKLEPVAESLAELKQDIEHLVCFAYPTFFK